MAPEVPEEGSTRMRREFSAQGVKVTRGAASATDKSRCIMQGNSPSHPPRDAGKPRANCDDAWATLECSSSRRGRGSPYSPSPYEFISQF